MRVVSYPMKQSSPPTTQATTTIIHTTTTNMCVVSYPMKQSSPPTIQATALGSDWVLVVTWAWGSHMVTWLLEYVEPISVLKWLLISEL